MTARLATWLRALACRLRVVLAALGAHRWTAAVGTIARHASQTATLRVRGVATHLRTKKRWTHLREQVAALAAFPEDTNQLEIVDPEHARDAGLPPGDVVCFVSPSAEPLSSAWLERLRAEVDGRTVAAAPQVVHPRRALTGATPHDARIRQLGLDLAVDDDAPAVVAREAGRAASVGRVPVSVAGASAAGLVVDRRALEAAGGLPAFDDPDIAMFELCRRLRGTVAGSSRYPTRSSSTIAP